MSWSPSARVGALVVVSLLWLSAVPASAQNPVPAVDGRVFPEPMVSTTFIHFDDFEAGILRLNDDHGDFMDVRIIGESIGGRPIYFLELTNEQSDKTRDEKLQIGYSSSIHANEPAGREGMARVIEDLVTGTGPLGDLQGALDDLIVNVWFPNPDSWAMGDHFSGNAIATVHECEHGVIPLLGGPSPGYCPSTFQRTNLNGVDLNREFPNPGWISPNHSPMSEPESQSVVQELRYSGRHSNLVTGTDLHGMIDSPNMMRAIIPNQDMDFHRMTVTMRFLKDLEQRVNDSPHFAEWKTLSQALCMTPEPQDPEGAQLDDPLLRTRIAAVDDGDGVWSDAEAVAVRTLLEEANISCARSVNAPVWGEVGHDQPFLWGARWDQIGYTDSGFTSDYLMMSPRSPTGGMGAMGTITEFAYSHQVPDNKYIAKLTDMHVAGVRETVRAQIEYTLLTEWPTLAGTGSTGYIVTGDRVTSDDDPNVFTASHGKEFTLGDPETLFEFNQVPYDVANTDFWADLAKYATDPIMPVEADDVAADMLDEYDNLVLTNETIHHIDIAAVLAWVEAGGNLILTDEALRFFDLAGLTTDAALKTAEYLGHSNLIDMAHPLLSGVDWNARGTAEGPPVGFKIPNEEDAGTEGRQYPQWQLQGDKLTGLDLHIAGTTNDHPSLGTARVGDGSIHFIGAALPTPDQRNDHRYGLAPYAVTALTYTVFQNAMGGHVAWEDHGTPFVPFYPADPLYGGTDVVEGSSAPEENGTPMIGLLPVLAMLGAILVVARRRTQ